MLRALVLLLLFILLSLKVMVSARSQIFGEWHESSLLYTTNTVLPAASKGVFGFLSFRTKQRDWYLLGNIGGSEDTFIWSENRKQRRSRVFLIVYWLLALVDFCNTNSPSFCPFIQFSHSIHLVILFSVDDYSKWISVFTIVKIGVLIKRLLALDKFF